ncbi:MAG TPA: alpha-(1-_3)-arabinofuranosyltransferase family protein, partial [Frankiaceae bacterium]|nr:alpha-(1->3)-arabinofuranosyltransferase family protein [Frankiaceae bacterium]
MTLAPPRRPPRRDVAGGPPAPVRRTGWPRWPTWPAVLLAAVAYVPLLLTAPGRVGADTKQYLYLDPGRLLARAPAMWDPGVGMGTVTHQSIGYLLPMGPFYWVLEHVGLPVWVAQRLWTGSLLFAAGTGVLFLLRSFGWPDRVTVVAALGYALSPYVLEYEARMSAILLPWAGLPWLVGIAVRGLRSAPPGRAGWGPAGWRWPAAFALVVTLVGSVNATSLIYAGLGPVLWLPFAVWGTREVTARTALAVCLRTGVLTAVASLWWIAGLATQAGYGLDVLAYTETVKTVASGSQASEVLRGLGNWYFYGRDGIGSWIRPARDYTGSLWLIAVSFAVPLLALVATALVRWAHRAYFVTLVLVGTAVSVGVYPYGHPSPLGALFKAFARSSTTGLALRSMPRAVPLVALGLSVLLAAGLTALWEAAPRAAAGARRWLPVGASVVVVVLVAADMAPLWRGQFVDPGLDRPEKLPAYQTHVAAALDARGPATRVLELPGADFSHYRWGATLDPVLPGIMDRPFVSRELIPSGQPASADLLRALDRRLQEGVLETAALPALARLMGVGDVELRSDLEYERFRTPRPRSTWTLFTRSRPDGLAAPRTFGPPVPETPVIPLTDEITLGTPPTAPDPPAVAVFGVRDPVPIVRGERAERPLLVSGNGEGLVDAAAAGLLGDSGVVLYTASLDRARLRRALDAGADLLLTDSNRRRAERWGTIRENYGYVERAGETPLREDPSDARLPVFSGAGDDSRTVAEQRGVASVVATGYGNPVAYAPADRPSNAFDGDPDTAWRVGA